MIISTIGVRSCGPQKYFVLSTIRNPSRNSAVAENDLPKTSKTPLIMGGKLPNTNPPITPRIVIKRIGFKMIDFRASFISAIRFGPGSFNAFCVGSASSA